MEDLMYTEVTVCISFADFMALPEPVFLFMAEFYNFADCGMILATWWDECGDVQH